MKQRILPVDEGYTALTEYIRERKWRKPLLVCGGSIAALRIGRYFENIREETGKSLSFAVFSGFEPNPSYESVADGVRAFRAEACDSIIAVGGGSAIDVAKCIKLYSNMNDKEEYITQTIVPNDVELLAVPTTAGTGSEATSFAVIYYNGEKLSVDDASALPSAVLLDASALCTLPDYQRKSTMMDALCHAVEAFWSVRSTDESRKYSVEAIQIILENMDGYISNQYAANERMLYAAHLAGKAIQIAKTTAGHAMCYKLTGLYGIAHGHAAALCVRKLWHYMPEHMEQCNDYRGRKYLETMFGALAETMRCRDSAEAAQAFERIFDSLELSVPACDERELAILKTSVNAERLQNNPVSLSQDDIEQLYRRILAEGSVE